MYRQLSILNSDNTSQIFLKKIYSLLLLFVLTLASFVIVPTNSAKADLTEGQLIQQNLEYQQQLNGLYAQQNTLANQIAIANTQAAAIQSQINLASAQLQDVKSQIDKTNQDITAAQANLDKQNILLGEYIKTMYVNGQTSQIELILTSSSFSDFVDQSQYLGSLTQQVQDTTSKILALKTELDAKKKDLLVQQDKINSLLASQNEQKSALDGQNYLTSQLLAQSRNSATEVTGQINKNNSQLSILRCLASGACNNAVNGDIIAVNESSSNYTYLSQKMYGQDFNAYGKSYYDRYGNVTQPYNYINLYDSGCLVTSLAMAHGLNPKQEAAKHEYSYSYMTQSDSTSGVSIGKDFNRANQILANGGLVIFGFSGHFVLVIGHSGSKYYINDPYYDAGRKYEVSSVEKILIP